MTDELLGRFYSLTTLLDAFSTLLREHDAEWRSLADVERPRRMQRHEPIASETTTEQAIARPVPHADQSRMVLLQPLTQSSITPFRWRERVTDAECSR
jgi:hypothetical protein